MVWKVREKSIKIWEIKESRGNFSRKLKGQGKSGENLERLL